MGLFALSKPQHLPLAMQRMFWQWGAHRVLFGGGTGLGTQQANINAKLVGL